MNYKTSAQTGVDKTIQLASHATLGCASGAAAGGDCASGAVAGVVGELAAEYAKDSLYPDQNVASLTHQQKTNIKELAGLASGFSAIFTGNLAGLDDKEVADNIYAGQRIGKNAAANNYLSPKEKGSLVKELNDCGGDSSCKKSVQEKYEDRSFWHDVDLAIDSVQCAFGFCDDYNMFEQARNNTSVIGNKYYQDNPESFIELPEEKSIYHNYKIDPSTNKVVNVTSESIEGYKKLIHPVYGFEVVVDTNNNQIVTNHTNMGTYNTYNPSINGNPYNNNSLLTSDVKHATFDVIPYFSSGNSGNDLTTWDQRLLRYKVLDKTNNNNK